MVAGATAHAGSSLADFVFYPEDGVLIGEPMAMRRNSKKEFKGSSLVSYEVRSQFLKTSQNSRQVLS
jgi:hypothetical protein